MRTRRTWRGKGPVTTRSRASGILLAVHRVAGLLRGRRGAWTGAGGLLVVGVLVGFWAFGGDEETAPPPDSRARQYREFDACLLTGESGITSGDATAVWQGMQRVSAETRIRVSQVPVMGKQSAANALPYFNGLIQRDCDVVLATGAAQTRTVREQAGGHPQTQFVVVGPQSDGQEAVGGNLTAVKPGEGLADELAKTLRRAVSVARD